jgi:guanylate kinase
LFGRNSDIGASLKIRLRNAPSELKRWKKYDYAVVNRDLRKTVREIEAILTAERLRTSRGNPA